MKKSASPPAKTPAALGYRQPAEWAKQTAVWAAWPHNRQDWEGKKTAVRWAFCELARAISRRETLHLLVPDAKSEAAAREDLNYARAELGRIHFHHFRTDRTWLRDSGPIFVKKPGPRGAVAAIRFGFTGWARFTGHKRDREIPPLVGRALVMPLFEARQGHRLFVLEGGAVDVDGQGTAVVTEECLLDQVTQVRNPGADRTQVEAVMRDYLGVERVIWLKNGLASDDTHGHVDDVCRFVAEDCLVACRAHSRHDDHRALEENWEILQSARLADGRRPRLAALPMPEPKYFGDIRLTASYANFLIVNDAVLVPTFNAPEDRIALGILAELFPQREIIGLHSLDILCGGGALHCQTQQQPA